MQINRFLVRNEKGPGPQHGATLTFTLISFPITIVPSGMVPSYPSQRTALWLEISFLSDLFSPLTSYPDSDPVDP